VIHLARPAQREKLIFRRAVCALYSETFILNLNGISQRVVDCRIEEMVLPQLLPAEVPVDAGTKVLRESFAGLNQVPV
jgi:hypothetical protein